MFPSKRAALSLLVGAAILTTAAQAQTAAPAPAQPAAPAAAPTPPPIIPFDEAVKRAATDLFSKANLPEGSDKVTLVIDPLIDGVTGAQSRATRNMERMLGELVRANFQRFDLQPFTPEAVAKKPAVLVGTFTAVNNAGQANAPKDAYRVCLAIADLQTGKIIAKGTARAKPEGIDVTPTAAFAEAPVWTKDASTDAYIKTCQGTPLGTQVDPVYLERMQSAAFLAQAIAAYDERRYFDALKLYESAAKLPGGDQLRAYNGIYLTQWKLNRKDAAAEAFGRVVDYSLANNRLAVKFLFRPGTTQFFGNREVTAPYAMWLSQIARRAEEKKACLTLVGHASPTGPEPFNDRLSKERAEALMTRIKGQAPALSSRLNATGVGFHENIVGTGRDDASDALDRRVEFKVASC